MRSIFLQYITQQAAIDPNLYLIVGDVGFSVVEQFRDRFPNRYINAGIAEQNMIGIAAGLAMAGKNVYVYSIIPFVTMRCFEQIRNDLCYQNLSVKLVGIGSGFTYGTLGVTHYGLEDITVMRVLPNMTIIAPGSKFELEQLMPAINTAPSPIYLCMGNIEELVTYPPSTTVTLGKAVEIVPHETRCIIATGNSLDVAFQAHALLQNQGIGIGLVSMPTVKPLDTDFLRSKPWQALFVIDEHMINGGLAESIARFLCEHVAHKVTFHAFGIDDIYFHEIGKRDFLKEKAGLSKEAIAALVTHKLGPGIQATKHSISHTNTTH